MILICKKMLTTPVFKSTKSYQQKIIPHILHKPRMYGIIILQSKLFYFFIG